LKQAYEKYLIIDYGAGYDYEEIEVLPQRKKVNRLGVTYKYSKVRKKFLGLIPYTKWLNQDYIVWYPEETVEYYECSCEEYK